MFLSRVAIDQSNHQKLKDLTHLGAYHNWVEQSFPTEVHAGDRPRHLWRLDTLGHQQYLLVLSEARPDLTLLGRYGIPGSAETKDYEPFLAGLKADQELQFRLTANPTYSAYQKGKRGRVFPEVTVDQQKEWLVKRAAANGFALISQTTDFVDDEAQPQWAFDIQQRDYPLLRRKGNRQVHLSRVSYEGMLKIKDLALFKTALVEGIGREKAYGMGLMTVIPLT